MKRISGIVATAADRLQDHVFASVEASGHVSEIDLVLLRLAAWLRDLAVLLAGVAR